MYDYIRLWLVERPTDFFNSIGGGSLLTDFKFDRVDIEIACSELSASSAPGADSVPAVLLKTCKEELSKFI